MPLCLITISTAILPTTERNIELKFKILLLIIAIQACSKSKGHQEDTTQVDPINQKLGLGEIDDFQGTWALKSDNWTKVIHLPAVSGGEGLVQVYDGKEMKSEATLQVDWVRTSGVLTFTSKQAVVNVEGRYLCGETEVWNFLAYDPQSFLYLNTTVPGGLKPATCFGYDTHLTDQQDLMYHREDVSELVGLTCSVPDSQNTTICNLPVGTDPICSDEYSDTLITQSGDFAIGRWFAYSENDQTFRCRVLPKE